MLSASRPIWKGMISFGMVSIPIKLFTATSAKDIAFNELFKEDHSRLKRIRWHPTLNREVSADEVVKGYEYAKGQYVELTDEDFEKLPVPSRHTIQIVQFVNEDEIDPVFFEQAYVIEAEEMGLKPFALLMHAMQEKGLVAIGKIAIRKKEQLCVLRLSGGNLMMSTLFYPDEIRVDLSKPAPDAKLSEAEEKMASALVDLLTGKFDPEDYKDEYRETLMGMIQGKLEGKEVFTAPEAAPQVMDLMEALRASLEQAEKAKAVS